MKVSMYVFTKADGSTRYMVGTTNFALVEQVQGDIWESKKPKGTGSEKPDSVLTVWDLEKQDWRSIRKDRLIEEKEIEFSITL